MELKKKEISPEAISAVKEALSVIYWKKEDLQQFIKLTIDNSIIISTINWSATKREIVKELLNRMTNRIDIYESDLMNLILAVTDFSDFGNLTYWDEDGTKTKKAKEAVYRLRTLSKGFIQVTKDQEDSKVRKAKAELNTKKALSLEQELNELKNEFNIIASNQNFNQRGFNLKSFYTSFFFCLILNQKVHLKFTENK